MGDSSKYRDAWKPDSRSSDSRFPILKVTDKSVQVRVLDEKPYFFGVHWKVIANQMLVCGGDSCLFCRRGEKLEKNAYVNAIDRSDGKTKALVLTMCVQISISQFLSAQDEQGATDIDLRNYDIQLKGNGKKGSEARVAITKIDNVPITTDGKTPTKYNFKELIKPLSSDEMIKLVGTKLPIPETRVRDFSKPPQESLVSPEIKTSIGDDDLPI